ncbi:MAG TPA: CHAT domain-containing protein [Streptosporangiaceae bacterium]|nr:CHAT domain-containing protein [Streptosporangiaceae bacterium]
MADGELERAVAALERLPDDAPDFERIVIPAAIQLLHTAASSRVPNQPLIEQIIELIERGSRRLPPGDPARALADSMCAAARAIEPATEHRPQILAGLTDRFAEAAGSAPPGHPNQQLARYGEICALMDRYVLSGELRLLDEAGQKLEPFLAGMDDGGVPWAQAGRGFGLYLRGLLRLAEFQRSQRDLEILGRAVADLKEAVRLIPADNPLHARVVAELGTLSALLSVYPGEPGVGFPTSVSAVVRDGFSDAARSASKLGPDHRDYPLMRSQAAGGLVFEAFAEPGTAKLDEAIAEMAASCSMPGLTVRELPALLHMHGYALLLRFVRSGETRDLSNAIDRFEEARRAVEQEDASPHASMVLQSLAEAYRLRADPQRGDIDRAVETGLASLRERAGDVLLQNTDVNALGAGRLGIADAFEMARWFLDRGRPGPAVSAIEFGRGIVLHAATIGDQFPEVLRQAGQEALAHEWERGPAQASDLRYRTMVAIEGSEAEAQLLGAPSLAEISSALTATSTDALIYLLPRDDAGQGLAVVVNRDGTVNPIPIPGLQIGPGHPLRACELARRDAERRHDEKSDGYEAARNRWHEALGQLCDWAWPAVIGPLFGLLTAGPSRVVLVPVGELGLIPWHASRRVDGRLRYACEDTVISYAVSARQFINAAKIRPRPWTQRPVLVTDSEDSLMARTAGIEAIAASCYPASAVFGSARKRFPPDTAGTAVPMPADLLAVLPGSESGAASVLHFGCHAMALPNVLESFIDLGPKTKLAVGDILGQARRSVRTDSGGLVVLAACLSDLAEADYDEALTLATAFLSAGCAGVLGARWRVEEDQTALFMVALHLALNHGSLDPARALQAAQRWMLDPHRTKPEGLRKILSDEVARSDLADPGTWAAFTYQGQ